MSLGIAADARGDIADVRRPATVWRAPCPHMTAHLVHGPLPVATVNQVVVAVTIPITHHINARGGRATTVTAVTAPKLIPIGHAADQGITQDLGGSLRLHDFGLNPLAQGHTSLFFGHAKSATGEQIQHQPSSS